jgi:hypothetical protein
MLKSKKTFVIDAVTQNGAVFGFASVSLQDDEEVVLAAVTNDASALRYASDRLKVKHGYFEKKDCESDELPF